MNKFPGTMPEMPPQERQYAKEVFEHLGCKDPLTKVFIQVCFIAIKVFDHKQQRYGTENIAAAGYDGVIIRIQDKMARIKNLMKRGESPEEEPIEDSTGDGAVYFIIGLMCRWGLWPNVESARGAQTNIIASTSSLAP